MLSYKTVHVHGVISDGSKAMVNLPEFGFAQHPAQEDLGRLSYNLALQSTKLLLQPVLSRSRVVHGSFCIPFGEESCKPSVNRILQNSVSLGPRRGYLGQISAFQRQSIL